MKMRAQMSGILVALTILLLSANAFCADHTARIKDMARLQGTTPEPLSGLGLVIGLNGTGDPAGSDLVHHNIAAALEKHGITVPSNMSTKNVAAVWVTATMDPNAPVGSTIDVKVSSYLESGSLEGGTLLMTPLVDYQNRPCVLAEGSVSIGGFNIKSGAGNSFRKNHAQVGTIPNGGIVKVSLGGGFIQNHKCTWLLMQPDFSTADQLASSINREFGDGVAQARSAAEIEVSVPATYRENPVRFVATMGNLRAGFDNVAKVVVNERTGTIIVGKNVKLREAAVAHGTLKVVVNTHYDVSQPRSFSRVGETVVVPDVNTEVQDKDARVLRVPDTSTVADVVSVLNDIGASPRDIIAILEALKRSGSLQADLEIM